MSFSIALTGSSLNPSPPHNAAVQAIAEEAFAKLAAIDGVTSLSLSGYTADGTGESITLTTPTPPAPAAPPAPL